MVADPATTLAGVVLAAGGATRFGAAKQLARLGDSTLVERAAGLALRACPAGVVVVTGAYAAEVEAALTGLPVVIARNAGWATGLASSLRTGLDALPAHARACLLLLCDQPAVDGEDLRRLVAGWGASPDRAAAAAYAGGLGVPAIFPRQQWPALHAIRGDRGARAVLAAMPAVTAIAMPHASHDVDLPRDLSDRSWEHD